MPFDEQFTKAALRQADGQEVPLTMGLGGKVIGKATLTFNESTGVLEGAFTVDDPNLAEFLADPTPPYLRREQ